jgi:hypothetical protein
MSRLRCGSARPIGPDGSCHDSPSLKAWERSSSTTRSPVNGAFEAPTPEEWLELDADSGDAGLEQLILADALLLGLRYRPAGA